MLVWEGRENAFQKKVLKHTTEKNPNGEKGKQCGCQWGVRKIP